ncbi:MAG: LUD domain-containing protein [Nitrososphaeria archaeon]|jgi:hypothetical protein
MISTGSGGTSTTQYGLPIDYRFAIPTSEDGFQHASTALRSHGFVVEVVDTVAGARIFVNSILPHDQVIFTATSETIRLSGLYEDINQSGKYQSLRQQLAKMDRKTQFREMVKLGAAPDVVVGSVHAVTEDGRLVVASATGSQLGPYAAGAGRVVWVVGAQKIVPDLETAMRRIETYSYPMEDIRSRQAIGNPSSISKILIINSEKMPGRATVVLVKEAIGF